MLHVSPPPSKRFWTNQDLTGIARTASYCGLRGQIEFATCNIIIDCFENNDNIYDWNVCMEDQVHASNHGMMGGAFNCNVSVVGEAGVYAGPLAHELVAQTTTSMWRSAHARASRTWSASLRDGCASFTLPEAATDGRCRTKQNIEVLKLARANKAD